MKLRRILRFHSWKSLGFTTIIYLSTIVGFGRDYYEAAELDGAGKWKQITKITIPMLKPTMIMMVTLGMGSIFRSDYSLFYQVMKNSGVLYDVTDESESIGESESKNESESIGESESKNESGNISESESKSESESISESQRQSESESSSETKAAGVTNNDNGKSGSNGTKNQTSPKTGDSNMVTYSFIALIISGCLLAVLAVFSKKRFKRSTK